MRVGRGQVFEDFKQGRLYCRSVALQQLIDDMLQHCLLANCDRVGPRYAKTELKSAQSTAPIKLQTVVYCSSGSVDSRSKYHDSTGRLQGNTEGACPASWAALLVYGTTTRSFLCWQVLWPCQGCRGLLLWSRRKHLAIVVSAAQVLEQLTAWCWHQQAGRRAQTSVEFQ